MPAKDRLVEIADLPLHGELTPRRWHEIEEFLEAWKRKVLTAARRHPARSYQLGMAQVEAFSGLLADLQTAVPTSITAFGGEGPTMKAAVEWQQRYLLNELEDALNKYVGRIKDELLYGLRFGANPTQVASRLYHATQDASVNWRLIARTEMVRANAAGRLKACLDMGYDRVWCPPHAGSCKKCRRLLENRVFAIADVIDATNYGRPMGEWVACIPLHPLCRHSWLPYEPEVFEAAQAQYSAMEQAGLTDDAFLDEAFDSSGQLRPEYADHDFSAAKTMAVAGLAAAVWKVSKPRRAATVERVSVNEIRTDLYQREIDLAKVLSLRAVLQRGGKLSRPRLSRREDGTLYVVDGQHRVEAWKLAYGADAPIEADVEHGLSWGDEHDACREAIAKTLDPLAGGELLGDDLVAKALADVDPIMAMPAVAALDPLLFDGLRLRPEVADRIRRTWQTIAGPTWESWSWLYLPTYANPQVVIDWPSMRAAHPEWRELADTDLHLALVIRARHAMAEHEIVPGRQLELRIRPEHTPADYIAEIDGNADGGSVWSLHNDSWVDQVPDGLAVDLAKTHPDYAWSPAEISGIPEISDSGNNPKSRGWLARLVAKRARPTSAPTSSATAGWHVAPAAAREAILAHGLLEAQPNDRWARYGAASEPAGVYVWTDRTRALKWAADMARLVGSAPLATNDVWRVDLAGLDSQIHVDPVLGDQGAIYLTVPAIAPDRLSLDVTKTADELDVDVAKAAKAAAPNSGVEHWITVHPHGEGEPGQPVLVRNNSDGTMTVIGGAGGNLNYLRIDPKRRIKEGEKAKGADKVDQPVSEHEAQAKQAEREQEIAAAREQLEHARAARGEHQEQLWSYLRDELGIDDSDLDGAAKRKLLAKAKTSALRTLAYGGVNRRDAQEGADRSDLGLDGKDAPTSWEGDSDSDGGGGPDAPDDAGDGERKPRPSVAMTDDHARALLDLLAQDRQLGKVASAQRKVIAGEASASDANQIDWSIGGEDEKTRKRAAAVQQLVRTDNARTLLEHADNELTADGKGYNQRYRQAFQQGGFDSIESFANSIIGHGVISKEASKLLGVAGSAQLVAHAIQTEAIAHGKEKLDLEKVQTALKALTDEQESALTDRGLARVKVATERAAEAQTELAASERGESLYTTTMARSVATQQMQAAKRALGMMVGGLEATSALKTALDRKAGEKIKVGGFSSPAQIKELADRARVKVREGDITKNGAGNYTLAIEPERLSGLLRNDPPGDLALRKRLQKIRTNGQLTEEVEAARTGPGMSDVLDRNQARGKLFLQATGSGVLAFDPGVGKTHVAIATAMEKMAAKPGQRALIVCPTNMTRSWAATITGQGSQHSVQVVGQSANDPAKDTSDAGKRQAQLLSGADFTIIPYESLRSYQGALKAHAAEHGPDGAHSIVIADELQKAKNEDTGNYAGVQTAVDLASEHHGDDAAFWGLTGTPIEKDVSDVGAMVGLARRAKGQKVEDKKTLRARTKSLNADDEHIARGDKIAQFRQGLDEDLFRLSAKDAGNDLGEPKRTAHKVALTDDHKQAIQGRVDKLNKQIADYHRAKSEGIEGPAMPNFGGRDALLDALYNHPESGHVKAVADEIEKSGSFDFKGMPKPDGPAEYSKGDHAGTYEHKHVVFGANELSKSMFGPGWRKGEKGGLHAELEKRGIKVFTGHGAMTSAQNESNYKAFVAHKGKAVFLTNDKNNAGISLQFGDNKGRFQHGATHLHHFTRPVNNATIQQREARILRKGAAAGAHYHTYSADTPVERRLEDTLAAERRTQDLAANSEQQVSGRDTLRHHLSRVGRGTKKKETKA